jgi:large subunit ribosomal protein L19
MMKLLDKFNKEQIEKLSAGKELPKFAPGDTVSVSVKIVEGNSERIQIFEGLCIAIRNKGVATSFVVRKISHDEGVERIFHLYSPRIAGVKVVKRGIVRRAKLYYMRALRGKAARIKENKDYKKV